jgi:hypothetical protein
MIQWAMIALMTRRLAPPHLKPLFTRLSLVRPYGPWAFEAGRSHGDRSQGKGGVIVHQAYRFALDPTRRQQTCARISCGRRSVRLQLGLGPGQAATGRARRRPGCRGALDVAGLATRMERRQGCGRALVGGELQGSLRLRPRRTGERAAQLGRFQAGPPRWCPRGVPTPQTQGSRPTGVLVFHRRHSSRGRPPPCDPAAARMSEDSRVHSQARSSAGVGDRPDLGRHDQPTG